MSYLVEYVRHARLVVELGTGDGAMAAKVMEVLPPYGRLFCVNWSNPPSGDSPYKFLDPHLGDSRLTIVFGDTREVADLIPDGIEVLHIDSTHTKECAAEEWRLYEPKLTCHATVIVDDLDHNDMIDFWDSLQGHKTTLLNGRVGLLQYRRHRA